MENDASLCESSSFKLYSPLTLKPKQIYISDLQDNCRKIGEFIILNRIGEGTYGIVNRAKDTKDEKIVAIKKVRMEKETNGLPISSCREISLLTKCSHENIVNVLTIAIEPSKLDSIYLVMEYCEHDLSCLLDNMPHAFREADVKCLSIQLLQGIKYLHGRYIIHRDLKLSNTLLTNSGLLKIADFGLARTSSDPPGSMTQEVVTLWYRAPELLLGSTLYTTSIDMWSAGCIIAELLLHGPLFPGTSEAKQIELIVKLLGTPTEKIWPEFPTLPLVEKIEWPDQPYSHINQKFYFLAAKSLGSDLISKLLTYDPKRRLTARAALNHKYFRELPLPTERGLLPTFPEHRNRNVSQSRRDQTLLNNKPQEKNIANFKQNKFKRRNIFD